LEGLVVANLSLKMVAFVHLDVTCGSVLQYLSHSHVITILPTM